jgi:hypothetical protein
MSNHKPPWNKGLRGIEAGWDDARRQRASEGQKRRIKLRPKKYQILLKKGPRPDTWVTGPNKAVHKHYYRFLKARNQAKFWKQPWRITWPQYLTLYKTLKGNWSRANNHKNLCRIDTSKGWTLKNVCFMTRSKAMKRVTDNTRARPKGLGKGRHWWRKKNGQ